MLGLEISAFDEEAQEELKNLIESHSVYSKFQIDIKLLKSFYNTLEMLSE